MGTVLRKEIIEDCTVYLADCMDVLPSIDPVYAVITDPPFGVGNFIQTSGNIRGEAVSWNDSAPPKEVFDLLKSKSDHRIIWGANYFNCFEEKGGAIIWIKNQPMPDFSKAEIASCSFYKKTEIINITWTNFSNTKVTSHPCERPVSLYKFCINYLPGSGSILDPFMGSGSVGVACALMRKSFIGIETEEKYFDMCCSRIEAAYKQNDLFYD